MKRIGERLLAMLLALTMLLSVSIPAMAVKDEESDADGAAVSDVADLTGTDAEEVDTDDGEGGDDLDDNSDHGAGDYADSDTAAAEMNRQTYDTNDIGDGDPDEPTVADAYRNFSVTYADGTYDAGVKSKNFTLTYHICINAQELLADNESVDETLEAGAVSITIPKLSVEGAVFTYSCNLDEAPAFTLTERDDALVFTNSNGSVTGEAGFDVSVKADIRNVADAAEDDEGNEENAFPWTITPFATLTVESEEEPTVLYGEALTGTIKKTSAVWSASVRYVGESRAYDAGEKTSDFNLKYQVDFKTDRELAPNAVRIRIPAVLYQYREGNKERDVLPAEIAPPKGSLDEPETRNKRTPFNYYEETDDEGTLYYVFFNYLPITPDMEPLFQVLYRVDLMESPCGSSWELQPEVYVDDMAETAEDVSESRVESGYDKTAYTPLTGVVWGDAELVRLTAAPYKYAGKSYTPELYTEKQVKSYAGSDVDVDFSRYVYMVYQITLSGSATHPYDLYLRAESENDVSGHLVGVRSAAYGPSVRMTGETEALTDEDGALITFNQIVAGSRTKNIQSRFYAVVAFDKDSVQTEADADGTVENATSIQVKFTAYARDIDDEYEELSDAWTVERSATWTYLPYTWQHTWGGDGELYAKVETRSTDEWWTTSEEENNRKGLLDVLLSSPADAATVDFTTEAYSEGFRVTHWVKDYHPQQPEGVTEEYGYIPGSFWDMTVYEDFLSAYDANEGGTRSVLTADDYYYSAVTVTRTDRDYDVYEDMTVAAQGQDGVDALTTIYAMYAGSTEWEEAAVLNGTSVTYTFTEEQIAREPYRVKAVCAGVTGYDITVYIRGVATLRQSSATLKGIVENMAAKDDWANQKLAVRNYACCNVKATKGGSTYGVYWGTPTSVMDVTDQRGEILAQDGLTVTDVGTTDYAVGLLPVTKYASGEKTGRSVYNSISGRVDVTYTLTASDGYLIDDKESYLALRDYLPSPHKNQAVFYDLLPLSVHFDPSVKITVNQGSKSYFVDYDEKGDIEIIENYRGTGRTLVILRVSNTLEDSTHFEWIKSNSGVKYYEGYWCDTWTVSFGAYYDAANAKVDPLTNVAAFMSREETEKLLGEGSEIDLDNGVIDNDTDDVKAAKTYFGADIDGDGATDEPVIFMKTSDLDGHVISTNSIIEKTVRADSDEFGIFGKEATVGYGKGYTYELTVLNTTSAGLKNIYLVDRLEDQAGSGWNGSFAGVIVGMPEEKGVAPVVYYSTKRYPAVPERGEAVANFFKDSTDWVEAGKYVSEGGQLADVLSVAFDLSKDTDGNAYTLKELDSLIVQIKMTAPTSADSGAKAYNQTLLYMEIDADIAEDAQFAYRESQPTSVALGEAKKLTVRKIVGNDAGSRGAEAFVFQILNGTEPAAYAQYRLYNGDTPDTSRLYAANKDGYFTLKDGQKAVFEDAVDPDRVTVKELAGVYWKTVIDETTDAESVARTFTNLYAPPIYIAKELNGVPAGVNAENIAFTFKIEISADGETWEPLADETYYNKNDEARLGETNANGEFTVKGGQTVLLQLPVGTQYRVTELLDEDGEWLNEEPVRTGTQSLDGDRLSFTNTYRLKILYITKTVTGREAHDAENPDIFTFQIFEANGDGTETLVTGVEYSMVGADGGLLPLGKDGDGQDILTKTVGEDGLIAAACAGKTIVVRYLDVSKTYAVREITNGSAYEAEQERLTVTFNTLSSSRRVSFTNRYLLRTLRVTKSVVTTTGTTQEFTFTLTKNGEVCANVPYYIVRSGIESEEAYMTDENGAFTLTDRETAAFYGFGLPGDSYQVVETPVDGFDQVLPVNHQPATGTLDEDGAACEFVNISGNDYVAFRKEWIFPDKLSRDAFNGEDMTDEWGDLADIDWWYYREDLIGASISVEVEGQSAPIKIYRFDRGSKEIVGNYLPGGYGYLFAEPSVMYFIERPAAGGKVTLTEDMQYFADYWNDIFPAEYRDGVVYAWTAGGVSGVGWLAEIEAVSNSSVTLTEDSDEALITMTNSFAVRPITSNVAKVKNGGGVPEGAQITLRVERWNGYAWSPAEGVNYAVFHYFPGRDYYQDYDSYHNIYQDNSEYPLEFGVTGSDGLISTGAKGVATLAPEDVMSSRDMAFRIDFPDDDVKVNRYTDLKIGDLRIVEVAEETDEAWGRFAYYAIAEYGDDWAGRFYDWNLGYYTGTYYNVILHETGFDNENANVIVNSSDNLPFEVAKTLTDGSTPDKLFQFHIAQVVSILDGKAADSLPLKAYVYRVYDLETDKLISEETTDEEGGFTLKAGTYARFEAPYGQYVVTEVLDFDNPLSSIIIENNDNSFLLSDVTEKLPTLPEDTSGLREVTLDYNTIQYVRALDGSAITDGDIPQYVVFRSDYTWVDEWFECWAEDGDEQTPISYKAGEICRVTGIGSHLFGTYNSAGNYAITHVTIPDGVTFIGYEAFDECVNLESVYIPDSVTYIGTWAFWDNDSLTSVTIPDSVTYIGRSAFGSSGLTSVTIPSSLTYMGERAFSSCYDLESLTIQDGIQYISSSAFSYCTSLKAVNIPESVKSIEKYAFQGCSSLEILTIGDRVETIGEWAFEYCSSLTAVTIPDSVTSIGRGAFESCTNLESVTIPSGLTSIENVTFNGCESLKSVVIPGSVTEIKYAAFANCYSLESVTFSDTLKTIGERAFMNCTAFATVVLPEGLKTIGTEAFKNCTSITSLELPEGLETLEGSCLYGCSGLQTLTIPASVTSIGWTAIGNCTNLRTLVIKGNLSGINHMFYGSNNLETIEIRGDVTSLKSYQSFYYLPNLKSVTIGGSVAEIFGGSFCNCPMLESVEIKGNVGTIYSSVFSTGENSSTGTITIGGNVDYISGNAFNGNKWLKALTIKGNVGYIGSWSVAFCDNLEAIEIFGNVSLSANAFINNKNLKSVTIDGDVKGDTRYSFSQCTALETVTINGNLEGFGYQMFCGCTNLTSVKFHSTTASSIDYGCFQNCYSLKTFSIPDGVTKIGGSAFSGCDSLETMTIPASVTRIENYAFSGSDKLETITFEGTMEQWNAIERLNYSLTGSSITKIICSDGEVNV